MYNMDGIWKCGKGRQILDTYRYVHENQILHLLYLYIMTPSKCQDTWTLV